MTVQEPTAITQEPTREALAAVVRIAQAAAPGVPFAVRLLGETLLPETGETPRFTLAINDPRVLSTLLTGADFETLGEAYVRDDLDIEGDIEAVFPVAEAFEAAIPSRATGAGELDKFNNEAIYHSPERDSHAIEYHYDQSNRVFEMITDGTMNYSCACYYDENDSLEQAQLNKMDRVCLKLDVTAGDRVLDIGCGWGGMISHAARDFGAETVGVTISKAQRELALERIADAGLADKCEVRLCDYRDVNEPEAFDKVISLGMVEHVGAANLPVYFQQAFKALKPGGLFLMQGVSARVSEKSPKASPFAAAYQFPDAEMPYLNQFTQAAQEAGFEVRDVENLREHYAWTHRQWRMNLEAKADEIIKEVGVERYRVLRLLFSYSTHYMLRGKCSLYQIVFWKPEGFRPELPLKRLV
jgi:cyclopropane-fatty-acyl-phospholipid synthase